MSIEYFIAKRIHFKQGKKSVSRPAVRIATIAITLGIAIMIVAVSVVIGFKQEIRTKTIGFGGHIQVSSYENNNSFEMNPIVVLPTLKPDFMKISGVRSVQSFANKTGIIKTNSEFQGIVFKGVGSDYDWDFFKSNLIEGNLPNVHAEELQKEVMISKCLAEKLGLKLGDSFFTYFINAQVRARKFKICGIYATNFIEYDKLFLLGDIRHVQQLNGWSEMQASGMELVLNDFNRMNSVSDQVYSVISRYQNDSTQLPMYQTKTVEELNPQIFNWLDMLDVNVWVILFLMLAVAGFNMISGLLILILERTHMIGVLKSLGSTNWSIRKIFMYHTLFLISKGMLWGNVVGVGFCIIQYFTHVLPLDPEAYYVAYVPVEFNVLYWVLLNAGTFLASLFMMIGPSYLIAKISPVKIIRFD